jgi:hypothetical protein
LSSFSADPGPPFSEVIAPVKPAARFKFTG